MLDIIGLDREQKEYEVMRNYAILNSGYKFIVLILKNIKRKKVAGIEVLNAKDYYSRKARQTKFHFEITGGNTDFKPDAARGGQYIYNCLDTNFNRNWLASCFGQNLFDVEDNGIRKDIEKRFKANYEKMVYNRANDTPILKQIREITTKLKSCKPEEVSELQRQYSMLSDQMTKENAKPKVKKEKSPQEQLGYVNMILARKNLTPTKREEFEAKKKKFEIDSKNKIPVEEKDELVKVE